MLITEMIDALTNVLYSAGDMEVEFTHPNIAPQFESVHTHTVHDAAEDSFSQVCFINLESYGNLLTNTDVIISEKEYEELLNTQKWAYCLEAAGVDNWDGYVYALDMLEGMDNETK